jgi:hypothetical protein
LQSSCRWPGFIALAADLYEIDRRQKSIFRTVTASLRWSSAFLEREDGTLVAWYSALYAPRAGGAYDSHHRTAEIAGRTHGAAAAWLLAAAARDAVIGLLYFSLG